MDKAFEDRCRKLEAIAFRICKKQAAFDRRCLHFQADDDFATMVQSVCLPENLDLTGNVQQNYKQGEQQMAYNKTANIKGDPGNVGQRGSRLTVQTARPQDSLVDDWNIDPDTGDLCSYEKSKTQFATFDNSTGTLRFWNRETVPSVGDKDPEGHNVDSVFTELNYQNDYQSVFDSILSSIKEAIAIDKVSFTNTRYMFQACSNLTNLDLSNFDTSKVTRMDWMFSNCLSLTTLDLSSFDTSNVTSMKTMFCYCLSLTTLDLHSFDTSNVTSMDSMFQACSNLTKLDVSNFNTSNVANMCYMFNGCYRLTLDCSHWNVDKMADHANFNYNAPKVIPPVWKN